jgi:hypothetical protein
MTRRAIALGVARHTGLEALTCGLTVTQAEAAKCVVVASLPDARLGYDARLLVTALAEL